MVCPAWEKVTESPVSGMVSTVFPEKVVLTSPVGLSEPIQTFYEPGTGQLCRRDRSGECLVICDSRSPTLTARARQGSAVPDAVRTQHGPGRELGKHSRPAPSGVMLQLRGHGHRPWLSVDDRCGPVRRHVGGMADENDRGRDLAAVAPARVLGEVGLGEHRSGASGPTGSSRAPAGGPVRSTEGPVLHDLASGADLIHHNLR